MDKIIKDMSNLLKKLEVSCAVQSPSKEQGIDIRKIWIDASKNLPKNREEVLIKTRKGLFVGRYYESFNAFQIKCADHCSNCEWNTRDVTHWWPINDIEIPDDK